MRKRERENPCGVCGHYHKYEEGEVCGICGHRAPVPAEKSSLQVSAFPTEVLPDFLYLGSYDNASRSELLKSQGITRVLNTVPACQNLYKNSFTYYCLQDDKALQFDEAIQFLEQCEKDKARVLVHCMSGKNRSPAIVIAYLIKSKRWRFTQSYQWVKERRPSVELTHAVYQQVQEYEHKIFGANNSDNPALQVFEPMGTPSLSFGFPKFDPPAPIPTFDNLGAPSIFASPPVDVQANEFTFGAGHSNQGSSPGNFGTPNDITMDST